MLKQIDEFQLRVNKSKLRTDIFLSYTVSSKEDSTLRKTESITIDPTNAKLKALLDLCEALIKNEEKIV